MEQLKEGIQIVKAIASLLPPGYSYVASYIYRDKGISWANRRLSYSYIYQEDHACMHVDNKISPIKL